MKTCPNCGQPVKLNRFAYYNCTGDCLDAFESPEDKGRSHLDEKLPLLDRLILAKHAVVFAKQKVRKGTGHAALAARENELADLVAQAVALKAEDWAAKVEESEKATDPADRLRLRKEAVAVMEFLCDAEQARVVQLVSTGTFNDKHQAAPVIVGKQLSMLEVESDPDQLDMFR